jgi:hypothetical protein
MVGTTASAAVTRILELTPILEVLTLLIMPGNFEVQSMLTAEIKRRSLPGPTDRLGVTVVGGGG